MLIPRGARRDSLTWLCKVSPQADLYSHIYSIKLYFRITGPKHWRYLQSNCLASSSQDCSLNLLHPVCNLTINRLNTVAFPMKFWVWYLLIFPFSQLRCRKKGQSIPKADFWKIAGKWNLCHLNSLNTPFIKSSLILIHKSWTKIFSVAYLHIKSNLQDKKRSLSEKQ